MSIYRPNAKYEGHEFKRKKQGAVTHSTDPKNEVNMMFIIPYLLEIESS